MQMADNLFVQRKHGRNRGYWFWGVPNLPFYGVAIFAFFRCHIGFFLSNQPLFFINSSLVCFMINTVIINILFEVESIYKLLELKQELLNVNNFFLFFFFWYHSISGGIIHFVWNLSRKNYYLWRIMKKVIYYNYVSKINWKIYS